MNCDPYKVVRDFESALCDYTGAKYAVTTTSCTAALMLAVAWHLKGWSEKVVRPAHSGDYCGDITRFVDTTHVWEYVTPRVEIPRFTYVGVPMSIVHAGGRPVFEDVSWSGGYQLKPLPVWDFARRFTSGMYNGMYKPYPDARPGDAPHGTMMCISFHHTKILCLAAHGGAILHDNDEADEWLRRARFDGRKEGVAPKDDTFPMIGWHCYMTPATAAEGLMRLSVLPKHNDDLPWGPGTSSDYPDLSKLEIFK